MSDILQAYREISAAVDEAAAREALFAYQAKIHEISRDQVDALFAGAANDNAEPALAEVFAQGQAAAEQIAGLPSRRGAAVLADTRGIIGFHLPEGTVAESFVSIRGALGGLGWAAFGRRLAPERPAIWSSLPSGIDGIEVDESSSLLAAVYDLGEPMTTTSQAEFGKSFLSAVLKQAVVRGLQSRAATNLDKVFQYRATQDGLPPDVPAYIREPFAEHYPERLWVSRHPLCLDGYTLYQYFLPGSLAEEVDPESVIARPATRSSEGEVTCPDFEERGVLGVYEAGCISPILEFTEEAGDDYVDDQLVLRGSGWMAYLRAGETRLRIVQLKPDTTIQFRKGDAFQIVADQSGPDQNKLAIWTVCRAKAFQPAYERKLSAFPGREDAPNWWAGVRQPV